MADLDEFLHNLNQIQRKWVYLEPIFGRGALPKEQGRFKRVDNDFRFVSVFYKMFFFYVMVLGVATAVAVKPLFHDGDHLFEM